MATTVVGVDISSSGVRAAEISGAATARPVLVKQHSITLPEGAVARGQVLEPAIVASALKQLWSSTRFHTKDVVVGVGNSSVMVRNHTVPKGTPAAMMETLPFRVQEILPFPIEDAVLDFYPIDETVGESGPAVNGLLVAAVRESVMDNVRAFQLAGLNPLNVDLLPFAVTRSLLRGPRAAGTTAIIDLGGSTTTVIVATDGVPQFVRIIGSGGDDLTKALAERLGIPREQAEHLKRSVGLALGVPGQDMTVTEIMVGLGMELIASLRSTLTYFATSQPAHPVERVILTGGGARMVGFGEALAESTRLGWEIGDPLEGLVRTGRDVVRTAETDVMAGAIGLALGSAA